MPKNQNSILQSLIHWVDALIAPLEKKMESPILYWREKISFTFILAYLSLSIFSLIHGFIFFLRDQMWFVLSVNLSVYAVFTFLFFYKKLSFRIRFYTIIGLLYFLSISSLIGLGANGLGLLFLFMIPILTGLLSTLKNTINSLLFNLFIVVAITISKKYNIFENISLLQSIDNDKWYYLACSFVIINSIIALSVTVLVTGLEASLNKEKRYKDLLNEKQQKLIKAKDKAEEADRLKTAFLANMSYEIRTPMNAIIGFSDLLANPNISYEQREKYINIIKFNGLNLVELIDDIIDLAIIEANQVKLSKKNVLINKVLDDLFVQYNEEIVKQHKSNIELIVTKEIENSGFTIVTDKARLIQVLKHLIDNALKFTVKGYVQFGYTFKTHRNSKYLQFFVKDSGIGIPKDKQKEIFERFSKGITRQQNPGKSSGLGLNISYKLVELLGGNLTLESVPEKGTTFYFTINYETPVGDNIIF